MTLKEFCIEHGIALTVTVKYSPHAGEFLENYICQFDSGCAAVITGAREHTYPTGRGHSQQEAIDDLVKELCGVRDRYREHYPTMHYRSVYDNKDHLILIPDDLKP